MAAPHVSGIATMCFAVNPSLSGAQVKNIIVNTATTTVTDHNSKDTWTNAAHKELLTYRMVDAGAAVELALNTQGEAISPVNPSTGIVMGNVRGYDDDHQVVELNDVNVIAYFRTRITPKNHIIQICNLIIRYRYITNSKW